MKYESYCSNLFFCLGNIYVADWANHRVRKITASTSIISTIAGTGDGGYNGDNVAATSATIYYAGAIAVDSSSKNSL